MTSQFLGTEGQALHAPALSRVPDAELGAALAAGRAAAAEAARSRLPAARAQALMGVAAPLRARDAEFGTGPHRSSRPLLQAASLPPANAAPLHASEVLYHLELSFHWPLGRLL